MKSPLILIISPKMDSNKKKDRNEDGLIRMGNKTRINLGLGQETSVELWPNSENSRDRIMRSKVLEIFHAYKEDINGLKNSGMPDDECLRVGFVTTRTFKYICRDNSRKSPIWLADTIEDTVIGGDPEFLLQISEGVYRYAGEVEGLPYNGQLGSDGPWAELRPDPEIAVEDFVKNIEKLLKDPNATESIKKYTWMSGCYYYGERYPHKENRKWPIGGHIHIGSPSKLINISNTYDNKYYPLIVYGCLKKVLDEFIGAPLMKIDGIENSVKRRQEYGKFHDVRTDHGRLEYRTPSGEWLSHPEMATIILGSVKAVAHAFFKILDENNYDLKTVAAPGLVETIRRDGAYGNPIFIMYNQDFDDWRLIPIAREMGSIRSSGRMINIIDDGNIAINKQFITALRKKFRALSTYREYAKYLDGFIEIISQPDEKINARDKDLKHTWVDGADFII